MLEDLATVAGVILPIIFCPLSSQLTGTNYRDMSLVQTQTNHNHEEIFENIETYKVHYKRYLNDE